CGADQVIVTAGAQDALHAIVGATLTRGDVVACGAHIYPGFLGLARRAGLRLAPMAVVCAEALEALCRREAVRALYVVPTNDNPTARTLSVVDREAIADVARRHGVRVIEDDAYGQIAAPLIPPIASFVPELGW